MAKIQKLPAFQKPLFSNNIYIISLQRNILISHASVRNVISYLSSHYKVTINEISVYFVGKKKIGQLHKTFFHDPSSTDCITFPHEKDKNSLVGEIFICPQIAKEYISTKGGDLYEEILLYVIHGFLHLLGYTDTISREKKKMRYQEKKMLGLMKKNNLKIIPK